MEITDEDDWGSGGQANERWENEAPWFVVFPHTQGGGMCHEVLVIQVISLTSKSVFFFFNSLGHRSLTKKHRGQTLYSNQTIKCFHFDISRFSKSWFLPFNIAYMTFWVRQNFKRYSQSRGTPETTFIGTLFFFWDSWFYHCCDVMWISNYVNLGENNRVEEIIMTFQKSTCLYSTSEKG